MQRAVSFAARLGFTIDQPVCRRDRARAPARSRWPRPRAWRRSTTRFSGRAPPNARSASCTACGLLEPLSDVLHAQGGRDAVGLAGQARRVPARSSQAPPAALTNGILLGSLIVPLGFSPGRLAGLDGRRGQAGAQPRHPAPRPPRRRADPPGADAAAPAPRAEPVGPRPPDADAARGVPDALTLARDPRARRPTAWPTGATRRGAGPAAEPGPGRRRRRRRGGRRRRPGFPSRKPPE